METKTLIIVLIVVGLVGIIIFQGLQMSGNKQAEVKTQSQAPVQNTQQSIPSNLQNLPEMVGGC